MDFVLYVNPGKAPPYAHRLLDALLTGRPLDFGKEKVPADIVERLDEAVKSGVLGTVRAPEDSS